MYLKSLEIFGFKSFAEKTLLQIEPGITVVIGPNGCGKSNIVDSLRWALGEKSAKNIRGEKMEDIIFNGTDQRKPLSLAEVSITMDNSGKILDIDSEAVTVTRRIYRDGESEYLINKSPVRLKDIEKLFMDTGIGKTSYSIMEQGKIDMILSTRAEDRRFLFEEAAGISRYKLEKKEAEKKLINTSSNLARINDIIKEIERESEIKSRQASKTKEYLALKKNLVDLDIKYHLIDYSESNRKRNKVREEIETLTKEKEKISVKISRISAEDELDEKKKNEIQLTLFELDKELHTYRIKVEDIDNKSEKNRQLIKEQYSRKENIIKKIDEKNTTIEKIKEEKQKTERNGIEVREKLKNDSEKLKNLSESRREKQEFIRKSKDRIAENKKYIKLDEDKLKEFRETLEVIIKKLLDAIEKRKAELANSEAERLTVKNKIDEHLGIIKGNLESAIRNIDAGKSTEAVESLKSIDIELLINDIKRFEDFEDGFRSILFDKTGIHAEKEGLDKKINDLIHRIDRLRSEVANFEEMLVQGQMDLERLNNEIAKVEKDIIRNENEANWIKRHIESLDHQINEIAGHIESYKEDRQATEKIAQDLIKEITEWGNLIVEYDTRSNELKKTINQNTEKRLELEKSISRRKDISKKDIENQNRIIDKINEKEKLLVEYEFKINSIEEYLWTEYEKKVSEMGEFRYNEGERSGIYTGIQNLKKEINELGPINNLAIEEYKELRKRLEYYVSQRDDIDKARADILSVIESIDNTSIQMFIETFRIIKKNFLEVFKELFKGGDATIELTDEEKLLDSGIEITARPPGKKPKSINMLSGGERSLTAIALLFATYMVRPSPFCFLDEIDAALDEENINRFLQMLKQFSSTTQFVVITHNKKTVSIAESIYGITMEEPGISKIVSFKMAQKAG